ncbi:hypothetical protein ACHAXT_011673 [Thalassiosira profunda]
MAPLVLLLCCALFAVTADAFSPPPVSRRGEGAACGGRLALDATAREVDLCVVGGGISGLAAAITAADQLQQSSPNSGKDPDILLLEADDAVGGRVRSDITDDGYILDRGFAVFIEEYPQSKKLLDYDALGLKQFWPGARVKLPNRERLATVSDPLRRRRDVFKAIASPVGSPMDKLRLLPLFYKVMTKSIEELFEMEEADTLTCLRDKYNFSEEFIQCFFAPFLEGIYLTPLENQSSRMFHLVMRMNTIGSSSLPCGGMQAVADQLESKAKSLGVEVQLGSRALSIQAAHKDDSNARFLVEADSRELGRQAVRAKCVVVATESPAAGRLLSDMKGLESRREPLPELSQRSVGCIYYSFRSPAPLLDPLLILNGEGIHRRNTKEHPINNVCFPSVVQRSYAPDGYDLCSVSILGQALVEHAGDDSSLDEAVRRQLASWFPDVADDIADELKWVQKGVYVIENAQPANYGEAGCANFHGGRECRVVDGLYVCGDHMATSTFNGALESGVNAGDTAGRYLAKVFAS